MVRDLLQALAQGDIHLASHSSTYAWLAAGFAVLSILLYFLVLCCSHLAAFRTATNMKKTAMHHRPGNRPPHAKRRKRRPDHRPRWWRRRRKRNPCRTDAKERKIRPPCEITDGVGTVETVTK